MPQPPALETRVLCWIETRGVTDPVEPLIAASPRIAVEAAVVAVVIAVAADAVVRRPERRLLRRARMSV